MIELCQLRYAYVRKVLRPHPEKLPHAGVDGSKAKLMRHILIFLAQTVEIALLDCVVAVRFGYGVILKQTCLSHEYGLNLEQVVAVMSHALQRNAHCPSLKCVAVDAESVVARHRYEERRLP